VSPAAITPLASRASRGVPSAAARSSAARSQGARRLAAVLLTAAAGLLCAGPANALFEDDDARRAIIELRGKVELQNRETQRKLDDLASRLDALVGRADRLEQLSRGQIELQNQIEALRQDVAKLRGQLETQTNELSETQRRQREVFANVDTRLKAFEPVQVQIDGATYTVELEEKRAYEAALTQFRAGDFAPAVAAFSQFRARYPASPYSANVLFWIGNGQYALKDYKAAVATHTLMLSRFPDHPRAADAMLNVGYSQAESGDKRAARKTLETVVEKYASAPAAQLAKDRLATLK